MIHLLLIVYALSCIIPLLGILSLSVTANTTLVYEGFKLIPEKISFAAYRIIFKSPMLILDSYKISIIVTAIGTFLSMIVTSGVAYAISRPDFSLRKKISFFLYFTMLFNGGLVPWYILISRYLHLLDTIWALIIPYLVSPWFVLVLRAFMQKIPMEIIESCYTDGANEYRIFWQFVLPLSKPGLATVALFTVFRYWNDWWLGLLFLVNPSLAPLQLVLYRVLSGAQIMSQLPGMISRIPIQDLPTMAMQMGLAVLAAGPILIVFPFFQKYFVRGLTLGSLKG